MENMISNIKMTNSYLEARDITIFEEEFTVSFIKMMIDLKLAGKQLSTKLHQNDDRLETGGEAVVNKASSK